LLLLPKYMYDRDK